jgi:hypothetical protein
LKNKSRKSCRKLRLFFCAVDTAFGREGSKGSKGGGGGAAEERLGPGPGSGASDGAVGVAIGIGEPRLPLVILSEAKDLGTRSK